jgi:transposase-like protein
MKNSEQFDLISLAAHFSDPEKAREFLEAQRWPDGPVCPHCDSVKAYKITPKTKAKTHARKGLYKCAECREQYTITVGTIFEDSHIPLNKWLLAIHLMCASKKGISAHQLHRMLGVTYKSAWYMAHRVRYAMSQPPLVGKLRGTVEADETYIGGRDKKRAGRPGWWSKKKPVFAFVERGGKVRSYHVARVTAKNLQHVLLQNVDKVARVVTDDFTAYRTLKDKFAQHDVITHSTGEYVRTEKGFSVHTNTIEGFFGLLKRGITGVYHQVGSQHLHRYLAEFDFRYNSRQMQDWQRTLLALRGVGGKRLTLREPSVSAA